MDNAIVSTAILTPILALVCWTLVMWIWLYATRLPALKKAGGDLSTPEAIEATKAKVPNKVHYVADNYNHLHEQPVIFYALIFYIYLSGTSTELDIQLAWAYVGLRVVHSLHQALINNIPQRFMLFVAASLILFALAARAVMAL